MEYKGYYINLDKSKERRQILEKQLSKYNLLSRYDRYPAAAGNVLNVNAPKISPGAVGCYTSHYLLLKSLAQESSSTHIHIIEDDVLLSPLVGSAINWVIESGVIDQWDLIYTDMWLPPFVPQVHELNILFDRCTSRNRAGIVESVKGYTMLNLKDRQFAGSVSYIVNRNSIPKISNLLAEGMQSELTSPIDIFYRKKIWGGEITAACLFPFVTTVDVLQNYQSNISNIDDANRQKSILSSSILRNMYFIESNPEQLMRLVKKHLNGDSQDLRGQIIAKLFQFTTSSQFRSF